MNIILPDFIKKCIKNLNNNGFSAFVVGGAIRDLIMNKTPHDFDIATNAPAQTVMKIFKNSIPTGLKHGTVTVIIDGNSIEITTFRTESNYFDNRHPEQIKFVDDICSDLSRRDFTVNAIAYNEKDGIIDEFGGIDDIKNKIIRTVGNPELRFKEDALRILRCFRFAAQLNFTIEQNTQKCAEILTDSLFNISYERIFIELKKTFISKNPIVLNNILKKHFFKEIFGKETAIPKLFTEINNEFSVRFAAFCAYNGISPTSVLKTLRADNKTKILCEYYCDALNIKVPENIIEYKKRITKILPKDLIEISNIRSMIFRYDKNYELNFINKILCNFEPYRIDMLKINGCDIHNLRIEGKRISETEELLLKKCIINPKLNTRENLIKLIKENN